MASEASYICIGLKRPQMVHWGQWLKTWSWWSNRVTRQVNLIGQKFRRDILSNFQTIGLRSAIGKGKEISMSGSNEKSLVSCQDAELLTDPSIPLWKCMREWTEKKKLKDSCSSGCQEQQLDDMGNLFLAIHQRDFQLVIFDSLWHAGILTDTFQLSSSSIAV